MLMRLTGLPTFALLTACSTVSLPTPGTRLSARQVIDLIDHPQRRHRQDVTLTIYPYDLGFGQTEGSWSYAVCFERCERAVADRSPFMVRSSTDRFANYSGARPVTVRARYDACNVEWPCADLWAGVFVEIDSPAE